MAGILGTLIAKLTPNNAAFVAGLAASVSAMESATNKMVSCTRVALGISAPIADAVGAAVKFATDFDA